MTNRLKFFGALMLIILAISACGGSSDSSNESSSEEVDLTGNDYLVTIKTDLGEMKAVLFNETPQHKENFLKLVREGFYDSLLFHRVIEGFMVQGGDPNSRNAEPGKPLGMGGPGYTVPAEFNDKFFHKKGALSAARQGDGVNPEKASSGSQFYIVQGEVLNENSIAQFSGPNYMAIRQALSDLNANSPDNELNAEYKSAYEQGGDSLLNERIMATLDRLEQATGRQLTNPEMPDYKKEAYMELGGTPFLDNNYTVFGQVIEGLDIIDSIAAVQTAPGDRPVQDVRMYMTVEEMPKQEIYEKYGYDFSGQ